MHIYTQHISELHPYCVSVAGTQRKKSKGFTSRWAQSYPWYFMIWLWVNTYFHSIFSGLFTSINPSYDLGFTARYQGFDPSPYMWSWYVWWYIWWYVSWSVSWCLGPFHQRILRYTWQIQPEKSGTCAICRQDTAMASRHKPNSKAISFQLQNGYRWSARDITTKSILVIKLPMVRDTVVRVYWFLFITWKTNQ